MPDHSAPQDPTPADGQSQPDGEAAPAGGQESTTPLPTMNPSSLPTPAEENAKGPDGKLLRSSLWHGLVMQRSMD